MRGERGPIRALRRLGVVLALLLLLALGATLVFALYGEWRVGQATRHFEAVFGPAELSRFLRPDVASADNAATWLLAGAGAYVPSEEDQEFMMVRNQGDASWTAEELAHATLIVEENAPALELLRRAAACTASSYSIDYRQGPQAALPPLVELMRAGGLLWLDGRLALAAGDMPRLGGDLATLDRLAQSLASESLVVTALIAWAVDRYHLDLVHRLVTSGAEAEALLAETEAVLVRRDRQADYLRALGAEGSMIFTLSTDRLLDSGHRRLGDRLWAQLSRPAGRLLMAALVDEFSALGELVSLSWPEVVEASEKRAELGFPRSFAVSLYPSLVDGVGKFKAGQSAQQLAIEALRQSRSALSGRGYSADREEPWVDPYTGEAVVIQLRPDGALVLEAPGAIQLWREIHTVQSRLGDPHFTWELPPAR